MVRVAVVRFPGSNCDEDARRGAEQSGAEAYFVWHRDTSLQGADVVVLPGGFSYGDYLRSGAIARFSPIMQAVQAHAAAGGARGRHLQRLPDPVRGAPAARRADAECRACPSSPSRSMSWSSAPTPSSPAAFDRKTPVRLPVAHGEGRFVADAETLARLEGEGQVVLRYVKPSPTTEGNPNGSSNDIAGICNAAGSVVGIMPHPGAGRRSARSARPTGCSSCVHSPAFARLSGAAR